MADWIIGIVVLLILGVAIAYIVKAKKKGVKCIGCPDGASCGHKDAETSGCSCCSGCHSDAE